MANKIFYIPNHLIDCLGRLRDLSCDIAVLGWSPDQIQNADSIKWNGTEYAYWLHSIPDFLAQIKFEAEKYKPDCFFISNMLPELPSFLKDAFPRVPIIGFFGDARCEGNSRCFEIWRSYLERIYLVDYNEVNESDRRICWNYWFHSNPAFEFLKGVTRTEEICFTGKRYVAEINFHSPSQKPGIAQRAEFIKKVSENFSSFKAFGDRWDHLNPNFSSVPFYALPEIYSRFRIGINCDVSHNFLFSSNKTFNMLINGLPVVLRRNGGFDAYFQNGRDWFQFEHINDGLDQIRALLADDKLRDSMGENGKKIAMELLSVHKAAVLKDLGAL